MLEEPKSDSFTAIREANTEAPNYDLDTDTIIERLTGWQQLCSFRILSAGHDQIEIEFDTLPKDMEAFTQDLYEFCPDLVDQGTECIPDMIEMGEELPPEMLKLIEGVDFEDQKYGMEILQRQLQQAKSVTLWWD